MEPEPEKCPNCDRPAKDVTLEYGPDPYNHDIHNDPTPVWLCSDCRQSKADDV